MTKKQNRKLSPEDIDELGAAFVVQCVADKWKMYVLRSLANGPMRFGELHRDVGDVSQKVLTQTLRRLEDDGLIDREVFTQVPPKVVYSLTGLGVSLHKELLGLCHWAKENLDELQAAANRARQRRAK